MFSAEEEFKPLIKPSCSTPASSKLPMLADTLNDGLHTHLQKNIKTSLSHPINITWIIPTEVLHFLSMNPFPDHLDLYDFLNPFVRQNWIRVNDPSLVDLDKDQHLKGNLCLSSCPGKKVRLSGPVRGRATINRDLNLDFKHMKSFGITMIVCCLDDEELDFLGAPWPTYEQTAKSLGMKIIRLPMIEGGCPDTFSEVKEAILKVNIEINKGNNVLAHCRGGVGRAGLFAGCWLLENRLCSSVEKTVYVLRERRSAKAIETYTQAEYLVRYSRMMRNRSDIACSDHSQFNIPSNFTTPSLSVIAELESCMIYDTSSITSDELDSPIYSQDALTPS